MCDTGAIKAYRANQRVMDEEEIRASTLCIQCDYCVWGNSDPEENTGYWFGWCKLNHWLLWEDDLHTTIEDWGCFG